MSVQFKATVYQYGAHARVDVPTDISRVFNDKGYISVHGTLNGKGIRGTFMPVTGGRHVLYINRQMARRTGAAVGDTVDFVLDRDLENRKPIPQELADAFEADPAAKRAWERSTPAHRKRVVAFLGWFSTPAARERKIARVLRDLKRSEGKD